MKLSKGLWAGVMITCTCLELPGKFTVTRKKMKLAMLGTKDETRYRINRFGLREKSKFSYEYDFGDGWEHTILVEKITSADPSSALPGVCCR